MKVKNEKVRNNFGGPNRGGFDFNGANPFDNMKNTKTPNIQAYDSIDAVVNIVVILELMGTCLTLILISSLSAMISIQRYSPLTILKERS